MINARRGANLLHNLRFHVMRPTSHPQNQAREDALRQRRRNMPLTRHWMTEWTLLILWRSSSMWFVDLLRIFSGYVQLCLVTIWTMRVLEWCWDCLYLLKESRRDGHLEPERWIHIAGQWRLHVCHGCRYHRWWIRWCPRKRAPCKSCCQRWVCNVFCTSAAYLEAQKTYDKTRTNQTIPDYTKLLQTFENMVQGPGATSLLWSIEKQFVNVCTYFLTIYWQYECCHKVNFDMQIYIFFLIEKKTTTLLPAIVRYSRWTKYSNPATCTMLNPRTPKSHCFSAKSDVRGLISFVHWG